eukprot:symbB.v1.2.020156.t1/scaffold1679.1/size106129/4
MEALGNEGVNLLYEKHLEEENGIGGVRADQATQSFLEASELGDAASLRSKLQRLNVDQRRELVYAVDQQGASGLLLAVKGGKTEVAKVLLEFGANPNDADSSGATAGHYASTRGDPLLLKLLLDNMSLSDVIEATEHLVLRDLPAHVPVGPLPVGPLTPSTLPLKEFLGL